VINKKYKYGVLTDCCFMQCDISVESLYGIFLQYYMLFVIKQSPV